VNAHRSDADGANNSTSITGIVPTSYVSLALSAPLLRESSFRCFRRPSERTASTLHGLPTSAFMRYMVEAKDAVTVRYRIVTEVLPSLYVRPIEL
jgi:hypothetical protein